MYSLDELGQRMALIGIGQQRLTDPTVDNRDNSVSMKLKLDTGQVVVIAVTTAEA